MRIFADEYTCNIPARLEKAAAPATPEQVERALEIRRKFVFPNHPAPYVEDIVRAFRLVEGLQTYVEIGTWDKGNLAYVSGLLAPDATIVDVDIMAQPDLQDRLRKHARASQKIHTVIGDSGSMDTVNAVKAALNGKPLDAIFIDGDHTALSAFNDYALYSRLVRPGGLILMHDVYWEGTPEVRGSREATRMIDNVTPVHIVEGAASPIHRFMPPLAKIDFWGAVGIVIKK